MSSLIHPKVPNNFGGIFSNPGDAKIWVFGVPFDGTTSYRGGAKDGPRAIREASQQTELYDHMHDVDLDKEPGFCDMGDMEIISGNAEKTSMRVAAETENILNRKKTPLMLGGEHSISAGAVRGISDFFKDLKVISFDAHGDLRNEYEGDAYNHACVMRRIVDTIGKGNLLEVGIREVSQEEVKLFRKNMVFRHECRDIEKTKKIIADFAKDSNVYISIDIDALDIYGTGTPQPDGLSYAEIYEFISSLATARKIAGMDLVEVSPVPGNNATEAAAAKLLFQACAVLRKKF